FQADAAPPACPSTGSRTDEPDRTYAPPSCSAVRRAPDLSLRSALAHLVDHETSSAAIVMSLRETIRLSLPSQAADRPCSILLESRRPGSPPPAYRRPAPRPSLSRTLRVAASATRPSQRPGSISPADPPARIRATALSLVIPCCESVP